LVSKCSQDVDTTLTRGDDDRSRPQSASKEAGVATIVGNVEIARRPEDVFAFVIDPSHLSEWQESLVSARLEGGGEVSTGSRIACVRHVGGRDRPMTMEMTQMSPPTSWVVRGIDGPVRGIVHGTVEPLDDGSRSRVTLRLDFEGHGIGKLLVPLVVRRQASAEMPRTVQTLKELLERGIA
jgi:uncharacterized protein YndB with AHSA1/START domain